MPAGRNNYPNQKNRNVNFGNSNRFLGGGDNHSYLTSMYW